MMETMFEEAHAEGRAGSYLCLCLLPNEHKEGMRINSLSPVTCDLMSLKRRRDGWMDDVLKRESNGENDDEASWCSSQPIVLLLREGTSTSEAGEELVRLLTTSDEPEWAAAVAGSNFWWGRRAGTDDRPIYWCRTKMNLINFTA